MKIDTRFDASRVEHFRNLKERIDGAAGHDLRKDLHRVKDAIRSDKEPAKIKDAIQTVHSDVEDIVDLREIKAEIKQVRADFRAGVSPESLKGDLEALKAKLTSFVQESDSSHGVAQALRNALGNTIRRIRHDDDAPTPTPAPVDPGPVAADGDETVTPAPGSVDFSA